MLGVTVHLKFMQSLQSHFSFNKLNVRLYYVPCFQEVLKEIYQYVTDN